ncbi:Lrp/AsnC family transcriptional regulator [Leucobacter iarius]|uniref:HTH asnC-type domain-containing protein n=1 Tax=Leucobacter iarius TaxID=333963 RepID=A0ABN2LHX3_9MICO
MTTNEELARRVLQEVRQDGRASYTGIAHRLGVPRQLVATIVEDAVREHRIRLTATVSPDLLGITRYSYLLIQSSGPSGPILGALNAMPETCFVSALAGTAGVDAEVRVGSDADHQRVLGEIRSIPGVSGISCNVYERIFVNIDSPLPDRAAASLRIDQVDHGIIAALERNGRATFRELGAAGGVSPASARNRLHRLLQNRAVKVVGLPVRDHQVGPPPLGLGIRIRGALTADLIDRVCTVAPEFLASSSGSYDLISTISAETPEGQLAKLDALRSIEQVVLVDAWSHLRITKELYGLSALVIG